MVAKETVQVVSPVSAKSNSSDKIGVVIPAATLVTVPPDAPQPETTKKEQLRVPRSLQLELARSVTFGVLGEDSQLYPSSKWVTENRNQYGGRQLESPRAKPDFVITSLDTRKHNPQTTQIFHIRRINRKPVCSVQASFEEGNYAGEDKPQSSVYAVSYQDRERHEPRIHRLEKKPAEGIIPVNDKATTIDVRAEMMLPVCDSTVIPSAHNPHRYLLRKRKVPPPYKSSGIVYPSLEKPRMTSYQPGTIPTGDLPFQNETADEVAHVQQERISVSSLSGLTFTRRKCIPPPQNNILAGFDGGIQDTISTRFDDRYLPFIRSKTII